MKKTIDYTFTLSEKVESTSCEHVGKLIGVTKDAVRQMLVNEREVYLKEVDGRWHYLEVKEWKRGRSAAVESNKAA